MSESSPPGKNLPTREYVIGGKTFIVTSSPSKHATKDAATIIRRLIRREILETIEEEQQQEKN